MVVCGGLAMAVCGGLVCGGLARQCVVVYYGSVWWSSYGSVDSLGS